MKVSYNHIKNIESNIGSIKESLKELEKSNVPEVKNLLKAIEKFNKRTKKFLLSKKDIKFGYEIKSQEFEAFSKELSTFHQVLKQPIPIVPLKGQEIMSLQTPIGAITRAFVEIEKEAKDIKNNKSSNEKKGNLDRKKLEARVKNLKTKLNVLATTIPIISIFLFVGALVATVLIMSLFTPPLNMIVAIAGTILIASTFLFPTVLTRKIAHPIHEEIKKIQERLDLK